jgi:hypothetical protein
MPTSANLPAFIEALRAGPMAKGTGKGGGKQVQPKKLVASKNADTFDTPEKAYTEAERLITNAREDAARELIINLPQLDRLPQTISHLSSLRSLGLEHTAIVDVAPLARLTKLERLGLVGTAVVDLTPLAALTNLRILWLADTHVVDLSPLSKLTRLRELWLDNTPVDDITSIKYLRALRDLSLSGTKVTRLDPIGSLINLEYLRFENTKTVDVTPLRRLRRLQTLNLRGAEVADIKPIAALQKLRLLLLNDNPISNLTPLRSLTGLQTLWLQNTPVSNPLPLAHLTSLSDAAVSERNSPRQKGLNSRGSDFTRVTPYAILVALPQPAATVETINYLRRQQGLPEHVPEGYTPPSDAATREFLRELREGKFDAPPHTSSQAPVETDETPKNPRPKPPEVPPPRPAAVEPIIENGRLTLPKQPAQAELAGDDLVAALKALKRRIARVADSVREESNIDKRVVRYLDGLAQRIPETVPPQDELFDLAHELPTLQAFAKIANAEWPDILAAGYHSMVLNFDGTVRQFPRWREFWQNASRNRLTPEQQAAAPDAVRAATAELRAADAAAIVDGRIPEIIDHLVEWPHTDLPEPEPSSTAPAAADDPVAVGKESLIEDALESLSNALKKIADVALEAWKRLEPERKAIGAGLAKARATFNQKLEDGLASLGEGAYKWIVRIAKTVKWGSIGGGIATGFGYLISKFPNVFGWLPEVLKFFL